ncbi:class I SAM-dependent DNA methyltransferase [Streptomyces sp. NPDC004539]|uniref:type I restriction-modification system subunit M n=1 Tax=Streptomyces sp. NPDC004539 TaxID=3154280 RepID=UPI0033AB0B6E
MLWQAVNALRGSVDAARYKEFVLGLVFLKYLSSTFEERQSLLTETLFSQNAPEERVAQILEDLTLYDFWVPPTARWSWIEAHARQGGAGRVLDKAAGAIMLANPDLTGTLAGVFGDADIDQDRLADLIDLLSTRWASYRRVSAALAEEYSAFLDGFARFEGKSGVEFHTPRSVTRLVLEILKPYSGRVYDPICGAGDMLAQTAMSFERSRGSVYGQERHTRTWNLARMNLIVHGLHADLGPGPADALSNDHHPDLRADFVMAHPPFNLSDWARDVSDPRWTYGVPPADNTNYAWLQHIAAKLTPQGTAAVILANGSLHARKAEGEIRRAMLEDDLVACIITLPPYLFPSTTIPACMWVLDKDKSPRQLSERTDRRGQIIFIDATETGTMASKTERVLEDTDLAKIVNAYRSWRGTGPRYHDEPDFCFSASLEAVRANEYSLNPGLYVTPSPPNLMQDLYAVFDGHDLPLQGG